MSQLRESLQQLEQAVEKMESLVDEGHIINSQQDLFGLKEKQIGNDANGTANQNVHVFSTKEFENKLNSVIGKMETLIKEG